MTGNEFTGTVELTGESYHHIIDVCRQDVGSKFEVLGYQDLALLVKVTQVSKRNATAEIIANRHVPALPQPYIHIALCVPRFPVFEAVLEKSVELGIKSIQPLVSDFSFVKKDLKLMSQKQDRWQKIVVSATQQTGRSDLMEIEPAKNLMEWIGGMLQQPHHHFVFAYEGEGKETLRQNIERAKSQKIQHVWLVIGGEGGFSDQETAKLTELGLRPVTLGEQVLRVETACLALASILKYEWHLTEPV
jgi:16S rRNA (uracil1498-N3)-methyltransferase